MKIFIKLYAERIDDEERNEARLKLNTITQMVRRIVTRKQGDHIKQGRGQKNSRRKKTEIKERMG
jgi:hypothetical protein